VYTCCVTYDTPKEIRVVDWRVGLARNGFLVVLLIYTFLSLINDNSYLDFEIPVVYTTVEFHKFANNTYDLSSYP